METSKHLYFSVHFSLFHPCVVYQDECVKKNHFFAVYPSKHHTSGFYTWSFWVGLVTYFVKKEKGQTIFFLSPSSSYTKHLFINGWSKLKSIEKSKCFDICIPGPSGVGFWRMVFRRINSKKMIFLNTFILIYHTWGKQAKKYWKI